jgi:hypothetical protein
MASIMLYYSWPKETHTTGYLNIGDANGSVPTGMNNCRIVRIDHSWDYWDIKSGFDCQTDDPEARSLNGCTITGYCNAVHEISRLYCAVKVACNYNTLNDDYGPVFINGAQGFCEILKSRIGFVGARYIAASNSDMADTLKKYLSAGQPVLGTHSGHMWLLDGYREVSGVKQIHVLNWYNNCGHHTSWWDNVATNSTDSYIFDLQPNRRINSGETATIECYMGDSYIRNTSNTSRRASIRLDDCNKVTDNFQITVSSYVRINGIWSGPATLLPTTTFSIPQGCNHVQTPEFGYQVPAVGTDCMKFVVNVKNTLSMSVMPYIQIQEYQVNDRLVMKYSGQEMGASAHGGYLELKTGTSSSPVSGSGLVVSNQGVPMVRFASDGQFYCANIQESQSSWLGTPSNLTGGLLFNDRGNNAAIPSMFVSSDGIGRIAQKVESPAGVILPAAITITGPNDKSLTIGQQIYISWDYDPTQFTDNTIIISIIVNNSPTSEMIFPYSVPVNNRSILWTVPSTSPRGTPLLDNLIKFVLQGYDSHVRAISANPIKIGQ